MNELIPVAKLDKETQKWIRMAVKVRKNAYAPYSNYLVGCAVVDDKGKIHTGCNVENARYQAGTCAEGVALFKMVSRGVTRCKTVVVVASSDVPVFPCGVCRQTIQEFGRNAVIYAVDKNAKFCRKAVLSDLMPYSFTSTELNG